MNILYTKTNYSLDNTQFTTERWEFFLYLVIAFIVGYLIHYFFSKRRDYVRTTKKKPGFYYNDILNDAYYPNSEPIYPTNIYHNHAISSKMDIQQKEEGIYEKYLFPEERRKIQNSTMQKKHIFIKLLKTT